MAFSRYASITRRFLANEENDLTRICEKCRAGFSLRRALARPRRVEIGSLYPPRMAVHQILKLEDHVRQAGLE